MRWYGSLLLFLIVGVKSESRIYGPKYHHDYETGYDVIPITEPDDDHYYTRIRAPEKKTDYTMYGIIGLIKLLFLKLNGIGLGVLLLLKLPIFLTMFMGKFMMMFKLAKFFKILTLPFMLLSFLPLLLGPLMLLAPLLAPLLLFLPIPILSQTTTSTVAPAGRKKRENNQNDIANIKRILESEHCIEQIACRLANNNPIYDVIISWTLNAMEAFLKHPKFSSYTSAYKNSMTKKFSDKKCKQYYICNNL